MGTLKEGLVDDSQILIQKKIDRFLKIPNPQRVITEIVDFIQNKINEFGKKRVIIGFSGGLDSAFMLKLCTLAIDADKILAFYLPEKASDPLHGKHAKKYAKELGVKFETLDISPILEMIGVYKLLPSRVLGSKKVTAKIYRAYYKIGKDRFSESLGIGSSPKMVRKGDAAAKTKHRVRMVLLYLRAGVDNSLVGGCGNRSEKDIGFLSKWGPDHAADIMPIGSLYKTQVKQLARYLELPDEIINKAPSPDMVAGITDEYVIGMSYEELDLILIGLEKGLSIDELSSSLNESRETIQKVIGWKQKSKHTRESPYVPNIYF